MRTWGNWCESVRHFCVVKCNHMRITHQLHLMEFLLFALFACSLASVIASVFHENYLWRLLDIGLHEPQIIKKARVLNALVGIHKLQYSRPCVSYWMSLKASCRTDRWDLEVRHQASLGNLFRKLLYEQPSTAISEITTPPSLRLSLKRGEPPCRASPSGRPR